MKTEELRSRNELHINKLPEFKEWLEGKGWTERETKDPYEALRMTRRGKYGNKTLLVHLKDRAKEHCTIWGVSAVAYRAWVKERDQ